MHTRGQYVFLGVSIIVGIASLAACLPPGPPHFGLLTLNNFEQPFDPFFEETSFACQGEKTNLYWRGSGRISARPSESFSPPLKGRQLNSDSGGRLNLLEVTVLAAAELTFRPESGRRNGYMSVELLPETLCTGAAFPLVGLYEATLEQTSPTPTNFSWQLRLIYEGVSTYAPTGLNLLSIGEPGYDYRNPVPCTFEGSGLECSGRDGSGNTFTLSAQVTETGFEGSYSGTQEDATVVTTYEGRLTALKQASPEPQSYSRTP